MRDGSRLYFAFYVNVKKIEQDSGNLRDINQWKFYTKNGNGYTNRAFFDYYLSGKGIPVDSNPIAKNILRIVHEYTRNKDWGFAG